MRRIKLSTEDIFVQMGQRMQIITAGIDTSERFDDNPLMLFDHNTEMVLGTWASIEKLDNTLSAIPDFDTDDFAIGIGNKLKKGSLKSASVGLDIKESFLNGDVLVIAKSVLIEASIVGIPANVEAKVVDFNLGESNIMLFSNGKEINPEEYIKKIKNMKKIDEKEKDLNIDELETLNASLVEKDSKIEDLTADKVELGLNITNLDASVLDLNGKNETLNASLIEKDTLITSLNETITNLKNEKIETLLNFAVEEGKISAEAKEDFLDLSFDKAKSILDKIIPSTVSLSETLKLKQGNSENKTYSWYLKNDQEGLRKLSKENPTLYKQIEKENK